MSSFAQLLSFPFAPLSAEQLAAAEGQLGVTFVNPYRELLRVSNGGIVTGARKHFQVVFGEAADATQDSGEREPPRPAMRLVADDDAGQAVGETAGNDVADDDAVNDQPPRAIGDSLFEFFGIGVPRLIPGPVPQPASLLDENDAFRLDQFLPRNVIGIGRAQSQSLICLSLNAGDAGAVYYWYQYWHYPWAKAFFDARVAAVQAAFPEHQAVMRRQQGDDYQALHDAVNYAMMIKLAGSLDEFLEQLGDAPRTVAEGKTMIRIRHQVIFALAVAMAFVMWWEFGRSNRDINIAAEEGDTAAVRSMLQEGMKIDTRNSRGRTPLITAAATHREPVIDLLLKFGASVNVADDAGRTPLIEACASGMGSSASVLLEKGANPNSADHDKITPLMEAARNGNAGIIAILIDHTADPNAVDKEGNSALMAAVRCEKGGAAVNALLAGGADPNLKNAHDQTALDMAITFHRADAANFLVLTPETHVPERAWYTGTDLMRAVYWGQSEAAGTILSEKPAAANAKDAFGRTALMRVNDDTLALGLADLLLSGNAKINETDNDGNTALIYAAMHKQENFVRYLLEHGAEPDIKNKEGKTASDVLGKPLARVERQAVSNVPRACVEEPAKALAARCQGCNYGQANQTAKISNTIVA